MTGDVVGVVRSAVQVRSALARRALAEPWLTAAYLDRNYVPQAHHRLMSAEVRRWFRTPDARLLIALPPQVGKSLTAVVWASFWMLAQNPSLRIIIACATKMLAAKHGQSIRDLITEHGDVLGLRLRRGSNRAAEFYTDQGGYVLCVGVGGMTTGFSANCMIIDDPFKDWAEAYSPTYREKKWLWASSVARTRLQHGGRILHVATRWNQDDIAGRFMKSMPGAWRVLRIPAIADSPDDPLGRPIGGPLPKPGVDENDTETLLVDWERARSETPFVVWEAMYQANPVPAGGTLVDADVLMGLEDLAPSARPVMHAVSVDPSVGGQSSASGTADGRQNTAGIVAGWLGDDNRVYLTHDATAVMAVEEWSERALELAADTGAGVVYVEDNQGGTAWRSVLVAGWERLRTRGRVEGHMPRLVLHHAKGDKATRAQIVAGFMHADRVRLAGKLPRLCQEWTSWRPGDDSPGGIDASGHLVMKLLPDSPVVHEAPASPADAGVSLGGVGGLGNPYPWRGRR